MKIPRGNLLHLVTGAANPLALLRIATAHTYPTGQITIVVPFAACGGLGVVRRILAQRMRAFRANPGHAAAVFPTPRPSHGAQLASGFFWYRAP
jgi:hypothetical protein